jgi:hypothetical protein
MGIKEMVYEGTDWIHMTQDGRPLCSVTVVVKQAKKCVSSLDDIQLC